MAMNMSNTFEMLPFLISESCEEYFNENVSRETFLLESTLSMFHVKHDFI